MIIQFICRKCGHAYSEEKFSLRKPDPCPQCKNKHTEKIFCLDEKLYEEPFDKRLLAK